jgi:hypothetical protein
MNDLRHWVSLYSCRAVDLQTPGHATELPESGFSSYAYLVSSVRRNVSGLGLR